MKTLYKTFAALALAMTAGAASAIPLSDLLNGGSIQAGDKLFDRWGQLSYTSSDAARSFNAANINVTALNDGGLNPGPGLRFTVSNNELSVTGDGIYAFVDLMFGFRATVLDPTLKIKDNSLNYAPGGAYLIITADGSYDAGSYIHENIGTAAGLDNLGTKSIEFSVMGPPISQTIKGSDSATFAPQSEIWVTKNILVWAADTTDSAGLTQFEQRFSQTTVPEPSSLSLIALGLAALRFNRRTKPAD